MFTDRTDRRTDARKGFIVEDIIVLDNKKLYVRLCDVCVRCKVDADNSPPLPSFFFYSA